MTRPLPSPIQYGITGRLGEYLTNLANEIDLSLRRALRRDDIAERTSSTVETYTSATTIGQGQDVVLADTDSAAWTLTLPPAADRFKVLSIINIGSSGNGLTIDGNGSETINRNTTITLTDLEAVRLQSDGSNWWVM